MTMKVNSCTGFLLLHLNGNIIDVYVLRNGQMSLWGVTAMAAL